MKHMYFRAYLVLLLAITLPAITVKAQSFPAGFQSQQIATGLNPTDMKISPDGHFLFLSDKSGKLFLAHDDVWNNTPILNFSSQVDSYNERGFSHLAIDPDFGANGYLYVFYTTLSPAGINRIARYTFNSTTNTITPGSDTVLLDLDPMTATIHTGGAMNFGLDGKLYVTTGESSNPLFSQNTNSMLGKVLRMNKDGSLPADNPFYGAFTGNNRYIYALGFRNPFTADIQPGTGRYFVCDVGQSDYEEINEVLAGKNYGWNLVEGPKPTATTPPADYVDPLYYYSHSEGCAIVGGVFYNPSVSAFPAEYVGKFFFGDYCNQSIKVMDPATGTLYSTFATSLGRPVALTISPSGAFYYLDRGGVPYSGGPDDNTSTDEGVLWKVIYTGSLAPAIAAQPQTTIVSVGDDAFFSVVANGLDITYQWRRNGTDIPGADTNFLTLTSVALTDSGDVITCYISNTHGNVTTDDAILRVTQQLPPEPVITTPADGTNYVAGTTVGFSGSATDPVDGAIPASGLTWKVDFHHDTHTHPVLANTSDISSGSFNISTIGEVSDNVWYRIYLTAENELGIKKTISREIYPQKVTLNIQAPPAIPINVDGTQTPTPANVLSVKGVIRTLSAPETYMLEDTLFSFVQWGNGSTDPELVFPTSIADTTIIAEYEETAIWNGNGLNAEYFNNETLTPPSVLVRTDTTINFSLAGGESPEPPTVNVDQFSIKWTGYVQPRTSGQYTFFVNSNDGIRLYVDGQLLIDNFVNQATAETSGSITLAAGVKYAIQLEYFDSFGEAVCELRWSGPDVVKQIIPRTALFINDAVLPVKFVSFAVQPLSNALQLSWTIEDLGNVKDYTVEKRRAGSGNFEAVDIVASAGSGNYTWTDRQAAANVLYEYRIKQTDLDGRFMYSPIRTGLLSSRAGFDFMIVPNPVIGGRQVQLVFTKPVADAVIQLLSADGRIILTQNHTSASTGQTQTISLQGLAAGTYYIKVTGNKNLLIKKMLVQ